MRDTKYAACLGLVLPLLFAAPLLGQSGPTAQAESIEARAVAAARTSAHPSRVAELWFLAAATWTEEAYRSVLAEDYQRLRRMTDPYARARSLGIYWQGKAGCDVGIPGSSDPVDQLAGAWGQLQRGGGTPRGANQWLVALLDHADFLRGHAAEVARCWSPASVTATPTEGR